MNLPGCGPLPALSPRYGEENSPNDSLRRAPLNQFQPGRARQRLGVRWVRGEGTHRFPFDPRGDLRKRCQPCSPPATALRNLAAIRTFQGQDGRRPRGRSGRLIGSEPHPQATWTSRYRKRGRFSTCPLFNSVVLRRLALLHHPANPAEAEHAHTEQHGGQATVWDLMKDKCRLHLMRRRSKVASINRVKP